MSCNSNIEQDSKCTLCSMIFDDPRVLPCGDSYCHKCIQASLQDNSFECVCCGTVHLVSSPEGFPPNLVLAKLVKHISDEFCTPKSRGYFATIDNCIHKIRDKLASVERLLYNSQDVLAEYCDRLRNDVETMYRKHTLELELLRESLYDQIDEYENERRSRIQKNDYLLHHLEDFTTNIKATISDWEYVNEFENRKTQQEATENEDATIKQLENQLSALELVEKKLREFIFDAELLDDSNNKNFEGSSSNCFPKTGWFDNFKVINLNAIIDDPFYWSDLDYLGNGRYVYCGLLLQGKLSVFIIDENERIVASVHDYFEPTISFNLKTIPDDNSILLKIFLKDKYETRFNLFNSKLELVKSRKLEGSYWLSTYARFIYLLQLQGVKKIIVYSSKLNFCYQVGLKFEESSFKVSNFEVDDSLFFLINRMDKNLRIGDVRTGTLVRKICLSRSEMYYKQSICTLNNELLILEQGENNSKNKFVNVYSYDGELLDSIELGFKSCVDRMIYKKDKISFVDFRKQIIYQIK